MAIQVPPVAAEADFPCCNTRPCPRVLPSLPRRNPRVRFSLASPGAAAFPVIGAGRLPHWPFRGLLDVHSRCGPRGPLTLFRAFSQSASDHLSPPGPLQVLPAGARVCRPGIAPGDLVHLSKAHPTTRPSAPCAWPSSPGASASEREPRKGAPPTPPPCPSSKPAEGAASIPGHTSPTLSPAPERTCITSRFLSQFKREGGERLRGESSW